MGVMTRLRALAETLDPRVMYRTRVRVDEVRDQTRELREALRIVDIRTQQLIALQRENVAQRDALGEARAQMKPAEILPHVRGAILGAEVHTEPFPYCVVQDWLPQDTYDLMMAALPASVYFADRPHHKQQMTVPPVIAPEFSRLVWDFIAREVVTNGVGPAVASRFAPYLDAYIQSVVGPGTEWKNHVEMHASDGRIILRRPGYVIEPHRDPGWGFITCLVYLAKPGDSKEWGTQLYRVHEDDKAPDETAYYVDKGRCELVKAVPFRRNTMLIFLNGTGAHGASIPADAQPPDLERCIYQFRLGPTPGSIKWLLDHMPADERGRWSGLKTTRATGY